MHWLVQKMLSSKHEWASKNTWKTVSTRAGTILHTKLELPLYFIPEIAWKIFLLYSWNLFETGWSSNFTLKKQELTSETNFYHAQSCTQYANKYHFTQWLLLGIFVRKVFDTNLNFRYYQRVKKSKKNKDTFCYVNFKSWPLGGYIFSDFLLIGT